MTTIRFPTTLTALVAAVASLTGCGVMEAKRTADDAHASAEARVAESLATMPSTQKDGALRAVRVNNSPWLGITRAVEKKDPTAGLPAPFREDITLIFPGRVNLSTVAERLTEVTGIPVKLRPDVFVRASTLLPRAASSAQAADGVPQPMVAAGPADGVQGLSNTQVSSDYELSVSLNYNGSLSGLLDMLAAKTGTNWEYKDGAIVWYRFVTKTFVVKSTPGSSELKTAIGKTGSQQTGASGAAGGSGGGTNGTFASDASVRMETTFSVWENMKKSVEAMLSPVGRVAVTEATGTLTVTDTRDVVDQVQSMVEQVNAALTRQVAVRVEVLAVSDYTSDEAGLNINAVIERYLNGTGTPQLDWKLDVGGPDSLAGMTGGSLGYSVIAPRAIHDGTRAQLSAGGLLLQALSQAGKVRVVHTANTVTLNRQPVPVAVTDQAAYVQSVSMTGESESTTPIVEVNTGVVTTGFVLNLLPFITDSDSVLMQFSVDISNLKRMGTFGEGAAAVQTPEVSSMQFLQRVGLKNGQTLVLSGFERDASNYDKRSLDKMLSPWLGGSQAGSGRKESIVILITPVIGEGV